MYWDPAEKIFPIERLNEFLVHARDLGADAVDFQTGNPAFLELDGHLHRATESRLDGDVVRGIAVKMGIPEQVVDRGRGNTESFYPLDAAGSENLCRVSHMPVEVNGGRGNSLAVRLLPNRTPTLEELGVHPEIVSALELRWGINLITGDYRRGSTALLAASARQVLEQGAVRIRLIDRPLDFMLKDVQADGRVLLFDVRETLPSFAHGFQNVFNDRTAAVFLGNRSDGQTAKLALEAAHAGIAIYEADHTVGVAMAVASRALRSPGDAQELAHVLNIATSEIRVRDPKGNPTVIREWLTFTPALREELTTLEPGAWLERISAAIRSAGQDFVSQAEKASKEGLITDEDLARIHLTCGRGPRPDPLRR